MNLRYSLAVGFSLCWALTVSAEPIRALPEGQLPNDARLQPLKDLDGYFPFEPPASVTQWELRKEKVKRHLLVTLGLWPLPTRTSLNPVIHGKVDRGEYTVEKVFFESMPGFYVTGSLYRPKEARGKSPAVLCPHGHWNNGRFLETPEGEVRRELAEGAERFEDAARSPLQARCVQLARMGCVVFHYDMIGYADSQQIGMEIAHGFKQQRPEMNLDKEWGLFSPQAESRFQSVMGLQTWNSIRSLDFVLGLPEVDSTRVAVTGASGGGTQTFLLCAIDPRPTVAFPAVMVSTAMQGGCTCENASGLRVDTGNVEFAGLFAPKPLGMTSANDWTKEMSQKGFPQLQRLYAMLGAPENVMLKRGEHFQHNYNHVSRTAMYGWINRHFHLGLPDPVLEKDFQRLTRQEMTVWDETHPKPAAGPEFEKRVLRWWSEDASAQLETMEKDPSLWRKTMGGAVAVMLGRTAGEIQGVAWEKTGKKDRQGYEEETGLIRYASAHEELPAVLLRPAKPTKHVVLWLHSQGKQGLFEASGDPLSPIGALLGEGVAVLGVDLLYQGESLRDGKPLETAPRVKNPREAAAYSFGYNPTVFAWRVRDILTAVACLKEGEYREAKIDAVAMGESGRWLAAAFSELGPVLRKTVVETQGFRFGRVSNIYNPDLLPGAAKYGDLPTFLALGAPGALWIAGEEPQGLGLIAQAYQQKDAAKKLRVDQKAEPLDIAKWLLED